MIFNARVCIPLLSCFFFFLFSAWKETLSCLFMQNIFLEKNKMIFLRFKLAISTIVVFHGENIFWNFSFVEGNYYPERRIINLFSHNTSRQTIFHTRKYFGPPKSPKLKWRKMNSSASQKIKHLTIEKKDRQGRKS